MCTNLSGNSGRSDEKCEEENDKEDDCVGVFPNNFLVVVVVIIKIHRSG